MELVSAGTSSTIVGAIPTEFERSLRERVFLDLFLNNLLDVKEPNDDLFDWAALVETVNRLGKAGEGLSEDAKGESCWLTPSESSSLSNAGFSITTFCLSLVTM